MAQQKSWPFKHLELGQHLVLKESEYNLERARMYALVYAKQKGWVFRTAITQDGGERVLVVKRVAMRNRTLAGQLARYRVLYGVEHLEIGRSQAFHVQGYAPVNQSSQEVTPERFRQILHGVYARGAAIGHKYSTRMRIDRDQGVYTGMTVTRIDPTNPIQNL